MVDVETNELNMVDYPLDEIDTSGLRGQLAISVSAGMLEQGAVGETSSGIGAQLLRPASVVEGRNALGVGGYSVAFDDEF